MNFDEYTTSPLGRGRVQIMFTEPISRDWEISLFMHYFAKHKKKIAIDYQIKPEVKINGIICKEKAWTSFLKFILREKAAIAYEKSMRSLDYDDVVEYLDEIKEAGVKEHNRQLSINKNHERNKKNN